METKEPDESLTFRIPISLAAEFREAAHAKQLTLREAEIRAMRRFVAEAKRGKS